MRFHEPAPAGDLPRIVGAASFPNNFSVLDANHQVAH
jgi:hypothetical protein